ncbi:glycoside hydrolase family 5 protein [Sorangium sp. So ce1036]|nr:glycoside hydrolase family 5 protein [Sorangium cellulosum]
MGNTPVERHGFLRVMGNRIVGETHTEPVQLKGMSLFWSQWGGKYYNANVVNTLVDDWGSTVVRAAMGIEGEDGYLTNAETEKAKVRTIVDAAVAKGIYVIIDWHDHNADMHAELAKSYFREAASAYKDVPNVIFEVFNEPVNQSWSTVKGYAEAVIGEIRGQGANNLVIVGSPNWSQDADVASRDPITRYQNIAYTLHFYANTHRGFLRDKATTALNAGLALFATEWGTCSADGNGQLDLNESQTWLDFLERNHIGWANWALNDKAEACSALNPNARETGGWSSNDLTQSGAWVKSKIPD